MLKTISFKKLAVLSAGIAIVLSSCGLQNEASDSSGAGKTKNFALLAGGVFCYDSGEEQTTARINAEDEMQKNIQQQQDAAIEGRNILEPPDLVFLLNQINQAQIGGCVPGAPGVVGAEVQAAAEAGEVDPSVVAALYSCVEPEVKQAMIDGYKEQIAKTEYPADWSAATIADYKAQMQRGLEIAEIICTN
jgi:hypothetical protein